MSLVARWVQAAFNFLVGDIRLLLGTGIALLVIALSVRWLAAWAGPLLVLLLVVTLALALERELRP